MYIKFILLIVCCFSLAVTSQTHGQIASALIREFEALPGDQLGAEITGINNPASNATGGFAFTVTTDASFSNVWGSTMGEDPTVLQAEQIIGNLTITSFESFFGLSDSGDVFYGTSTNDSMTGVTVLDGVFLNDMLILNEEDPIAAIPGQFSSFNSRPGITGNGIPYWVGGITSVAGGNTENRVLFLGSDATPVVMAGDPISGIVEPLSAGSAIDFDARFSGQGTNYIMIGDVDSTPGDDAVAVSNGAAMTADGVVIREGNLIPASIGGIGDAYDNFDFLGITEAGGFMITGDSDGNTSTDEFVMIDGEIVLREGALIEPSTTITGSIEAAAMNEDGDWAVIWDIDRGLFQSEALFINGELVLEESDAVDFNGDGVIDSIDNDAQLIEFTGLNAISISNRSASGEFRVYFVADVSLSGVTIETAFEMTVNVLKGDVNMDGLINLLDVAPFVDAIATGTFSAGADVNCDGEVNLLDVAPFVAVLSGG